MLTTGLFIISLVSLTGQTTLFTEPNIDYRLLRDVTCRMETQGIAKPDFAVGTVTSQTGGLPWGRCQLKYWSAVGVGFSKDRNPGDLFKEETNREFSLKIYLGCKVRLHKKNISVTIKRLAHCYGSGRISWKANSAYAKSVQGLYANANFKYKFDRDKQLEAWARVEQWAEIYRRIGKTKSKEELKERWWVRLGNWVERIGIGKEIKDNNFLWEL